MWLQVISADLKWQNKTATEALIIIPCSRILYSLSRVFVCIGSALCIVLLVKGAAQTTSPSSGGTIHQGVLGLRNSFNKRVSKQDASNTAAASYHELFRTRTSHVELH